MKNDTKKSKSNYDSTSKKGLTKPQGRSFCCSIFIYTFVFVSGVVVATILPDLAGHHLKQPYGKQYGVMAEQILQDLPKHLKNWSETAIIYSRDLIDRVWELKAELERRFASTTAQSSDSKKAKTTSQRSEGRNKDHSHTGKTHN